MRNPSLTGLVGRIASIERQLRDLRLRQTIERLAPVTELTAKLYNDTDGLFEDLIETRLGYYVDRGRCYMTGEVSWHATTRGNGGLFLFADSDGMPAETTPHRGWVRVEIPYAWEASDTGFVGTTGGSYLTVDLTGAFVEAVVHGEIIPGLVYFAFQRSIIPNPVAPTSTDEPTPLIDAGVVDGGYLNFDQVSWRTT